MCIFVGKKALPTLQKKGRLLNQRPAFFNDVMVQTLFDIAHQTSCMITGININNLAGNTAGQFRA